MASFQGEANQQSSVYEQATRLGVRTVGISDANSYRILGTLDALLSQKAREGKVEEYALAQTITETLAIHTADFFHLQQIGMRLWLEASGKKLLASYDYPD